MCLQNRLSFLQINTILTCKERINNICMRIISVYVELFLYQRFENDAILPDIKFFLRFFLGRENNATKMWKSGKKQIVYWNLKTDKG